MMMNRFSRISLVCLGGALLLLAGCTPSSPGDLPVPTPSAHPAAAQELLANLASILGESPDAIKESPFEERFLTHALSGYALQHVIHPDEQDIWEKIEKVFEGRVVLFQGESAMGFAQNYYQDRLVCSVSSYVMVDPQDNELEALLYSDDEAERLKGENILENSDSLLDIVCAEFREDDISPLDLSFDLRGENWNASMKLDRLSLAFSTEESEDLLYKEVYLDNVFHSGTALVFTGEIYEYGALV